MKSTNKNKVSKAKSQSKKTLSTEDEIRGLKSEVEDYNEKFLRAVADFDNFRKRVERDREQQVLRMKGELFTKFVEIIDTLNVASKAKYPDLKSAQEGISGLQKLVINFMNSMNIERFSPIGKEFDFRRHEVLTTIDKEDIEPNTIVEVIQSGYMIEGELLRPAKVVVSKNFDKKEKKVEGE